MWVLKLLGEQPSITLLHGLGQGLGKEAKLGVYLECCECAVAARQVPFALKTITAHPGNQPRCGQGSGVGRAQWWHDRSQEPGAPGSPASISLVPTALPLLSALQSGEASLFEVNIRYIGGLLSAFYLTGEEVS